LREGGVLEPIPYLSAGRFDRTGNGTRFEMLARNRLQLPLLAQHTLLAAQLLPFACELWQLHHLREIGDKEPVLLALEVSQRSLRAPLLRLQVLGEPLSHVGALEGCRHLVGISQHRTQITLMVPVCCGRDSAELEGEVSFARRMVPEATSLPLDILVDALRR
jgi:hypothetical protein